MESIWPWLAVAGVGALHGLNPASGWAFAAAGGLRSGARRPVLRALLPIAAGHTTSVVLVAAAAMLGMAMDRATLQLLAGAVLMMAALATAAHLRARKRQPDRSLARHAALALWSCMMSTAHGAGLMLVPALIPLCLSDSPARQITASGSLALGLAAVGIHTTAMLAVTTLAGTLAVALARSKIAQSLLSAAHQYYGMVPIPSYL